MAALPGVRGGGAVRLLPAGRPLYLAGAGIARQLPAALRPAEDERDHRRPVQFRHPRHRADRGRHLRLQAGGPADPRTRRAHPGDLPRARRAAGRRGAAVPAAPSGDRRDHSRRPPSRRDRGQSALLPPSHPGRPVARAEGCQAASPGGTDAMSAAWAAIDPAAVLPEDGYEGTLVGRAWLPAADGRVAGPAVVAIRAAGIFDLGAAAPTMAELCAAPDPAKLARQTIGRRIGDLGSLLANSLAGARDPSRPWLLAPCDLQAVKA